MIEPEVLVQVEKIIRSVVEHGFGEIRISVQDGLITRVNPEYSYKIRQPDLTEIQGISIIEVIK